jgi:RNase P subunit RPR2
MFDCECVPSRPETAKVYATRWKTYRSLNYIVLKCRDCGRMYHFEIRYPGERVIVREKGEDYDE